MKKFELFKPILTPKIEIPQKKLIVIPRQTETVSVAIDAARVKQVEQELKTAHLTPSK